MRESTGILFQRPAETCVGGCRQQQLVALSSPCTAKSQQPAPTILPGDTLKSALRKVGSVITSMITSMDNTQQQLCDEQAAHGRTREELQQFQALLDSERTAHASTWQRLQDAAVQARDQGWQKLTVQGDLRRERAASRTAIGCMAKGPMPPLTGQMQT